MTDKAVLKYYEKKRLVIWRINERELAKHRVYFLEYKFRMINPFLERQEKQALEIQLGEAYLNFMILHTNKKKQAFNN